MKEAGTKAALAEEENTQLTQQVTDLQTEIAALEALISSGTPDGGTAKVHLGGMTILYVGGRPHQMPQFKKFAEDAGANFLHHDGGVEASSSCLAALIARAGAVLFPVDCVSHSAVTIMKRICGQLGKDYFPMRSSGLSSFAGAVHRLGNKNGNLVWHPSTDPDADEAA